MSEFLTNKTEIEAWLQTYQVKYSYINEKNLTVEAEDVNLSHKNLTFLPVQFVFARSFDISHNALTSLLGCPREVRDYFDCSNNLITNLVGGPQKAEHYTCHFNPKLESLFGAPDEVQKQFFLKSNPLLTSFLHSPKFVDTYISVDCPMTDLLNLDTVIKKEFVLSQPKGMRIPGLEGMYREEVNMKTFTPGELLAIQKTLRERHLLEEALGESASSAKKSLVKI